MQRAALFTPLLCLLLALLPFVAGCVVTNEGIEEKPVALEEIFPPSKTVASYRQVNRPKAAGSDDLAAQLGGRPKLEVLRKWSAFSSQQCDYGLPDKPPKVRVTVTEMANKVDAYGAYTNIRPGLLPESQYIKMGVHGTIDGERLIFVQDRYVIAVRDLDRTPEEQRRALLFNFASAISNRIPKPIMNIDPVAFLPAGNRVPASERMDKEDPLGTNVFRKGAVTALYRIKAEDGSGVRECKVFLTHVTGKEAAELKDLKKLMEKNGTVLETEVGDRGYKGQLQGQRCLVAQRDTVVFGALGTYREEEMIELLSTIDRRIRPYTVLQYKDLQKDKEKEDRKPGGLQWVP